MVRWRSCIQNGNEWNRCNGNQWNIYPDHSRSYRTLLALDRTCSPTSLGRAQGATSPRGPPELRALKASNQINQNSIKSYRNLLLILQISSIYRIQTSLCFSLLREMLHAILSAENVLTYFLVRNFSAAFFFSWFSNVFNLKLRNLRILLLSFCIFGGPRPKMSCVRYGSGQLGGGNLLY